MNGAPGLYVLRLAALTPRWMVLALFAAAADFHRVIYCAFEV
jgi:hypothetical protein